MICVKFFIEKSDTQYTARYRNDMSKNFTTRRSNQLNSFTPEYIR